MGLHVHFRQIPVGGKMERSRERNYRSFVGGVIDLQDVASAGLESECRRCGSFVSLVITGPEDSYQQSPLTPLLLSFTLQAKAVHIRNRNSLLGGPESVCGDSGPPSHLSPLPINPQGHTRPCTPSGDTHPPRNTALPCTRWHSLMLLPPSKSHPLPSCQSRERIPTPAAHAPNQLRDLGSRVGTP